MKLKDVERAIRRFGIARLTAFLHRAGKRDAKLREPLQWGSRPYRILFLRHDRIGDMIISTGLFRAIACSHPLITLDVLASAANASVVRDDPHVSRIIAIRPWHLFALIAELRRARYDAVIDCMPTAPSLTTMLLMLMSGAPHRIGVSGRGNDAALTIAVPPRTGAKHIIDHLSALAAAFGLDPNTIDFTPTLELRVDEYALANEMWTVQARDRVVPAKRRLLVNISAGSARRYWPIDRFVTVINQIQEKFPDVQVLLLTAPNDIERAEEIAHSSSASVARTKNIRQALALVATADAILTADTSITHAASAFRKPAVVMFMRGRAAIWGSYHSPGFAIEHTEGTLSSLPVAPVEAAMAEVLSASPASAQQTLA